MQTSIRPPCVRGQLGFRSPEAGQRCL